MVKEFIEKQKKIKRNGECVEISNTMIPFRNMLIPKHYLDFAMNFLVLIQCVQIAHLSIEINLFMNLIEKPKFFITPESH